MREDSLCVICFSKPPNSVFMPCGHGCVCDECALEIFDDKGICPMCREVGLGHEGSKKCT